MSSLPIRLGKHHPLLKELRRLHTPAQRRKEGLFLVEGPKLVEEARAAGLVFRHLFFCPDRVQQLPSSFACPVYEVEADILARLATTETDQGLLGVAEIPAFQTVSLSAVPSLLVLEEVSDPGNVGTLLRAARAAGVGGVVLRGGADPYSTKVVRASAGALFRLPVWRDVTLAMLVESGFTLVAAVARDGQNPYHVKLPRRPAWVLGSEGQGLAGSSVSQCELRVTLPMQGDCESLNVAMAGTILMFEWRRQQC